MELRSYQERISNDAAERLKTKKIVYLAMEVRTGKTLTSLAIAEKGGYKKVLFLTKKKAIKSVLNDFKKSGYSFDLEVINDESMHFITSNDFDLVIHDEHHRFAAYPKPGKTAKEFRRRFSHLPMIFLSGTPTPESYSQWYHQFWVSDYSPFYEYQNFYKWANKFVNINIKYLGYATVKDYSNADKSKFMGMIKNYIFRFTKEEAGFLSKVKEDILYVDIKTNELINSLKKKLVLKNSKGNIILADTAVKLQQKLHQMYSGTVKFEDGSSKVLDHSKAVFIKNHFKGKKIAIFYKFKAELVALSDIFQDELCTDLETFNNSNKNIALQIVSGREGISLKEADCLVFYNIDFSAVSYWQSRDRLTTKERMENQIYWIFSRNGIEDQIYKTVLSKKDFTLSIFKSWQADFKQKQ